MSTSNDNTGLPCPECGEPLKRIHIERIDGKVLVRVNVEIPESAAKRELLGLIGLLRVFAK